MYQLGFPELFSFFIWFSGGGMSLGGKGAAALAPFLSEV